MNSVLNRMSLKAIVMALALQYILLASSYCLYWWAKQVCLLGPLTSGVIAFSVVVETHPQPCLRVCLVTHTLKGTNTMMH